MKSALKISEDNEQIYENSCRFCGEPNCKNLNIENSWGETFFDITKRLFSFTAETLNGFKICTDCLAIIELICRFYKQVQNISLIFLKAEQSIGINNIFQLNNRSVAEYVETNNLDSLDEDIEREPIIEFINVENTFRSEETDIIFDGDLDNIISQEIIEIEKQEIFQKTDRDDNCSEIKSENPLNFFSPKLSSIQDKVDHPVKTNKNVQKNAFKNNKSQINKDTKCPHCEKRFQTGELLSNHLFSEHSTQKPVVCKNCNQGFTSRNLLLLHEINGKCSCECKTCGRKIANSFLLKQHQKLHCVDEKKEPTFHKCPYCEKNYAKNFSLGCHILDKHSDNIPFVCQICNKKCPTEYSLFKHGKIAHGVPGQKCPSRQSCKCEICGKTLSSRKNLRNHQKLHLSEEEAERQAAAFFKCPHCELKYPNKSSMVNHVRRQHFKEKVICETCGNEFANNWTLKLHQVQHLSAEERPIYKCETCNQNFTTYLTLQEHKKIHFSIDEKQIYFRNLRLQKQKAAQKLVRRALKEKKTFTCKICNKGFALKRSLLNHEKKVHLVLKF